MYCALVCSGHMPQHVHAHVGAHAHRHTHTHRQMHLAFIFIVAQARKQLLSFPTWRGPPCHSRSLRERETDRQREREREIFFTASLSPLSHSSLLQAGGSAGCQLQTHCVSLWGAPTCSSQGCSGCWEQSTFLCVSTSSPAQHDGGVLKCLLR